VFIPKPDGRLRPLGVAALEDKILQRAVVEVLNAVYEEDFRGFSYGFRPGRSQHDALDALATGITRKRVNFVLDADISDFFTGLDQSWLVKFLEHRIADKRILRLIQKWLRAGVIEDGEWSSTEVGTAQGASVSPLLSNVFLHYVFDLWADQWRRRNARGDVILVRFADDYVAGFEHREDAERFLADLRDSFAEFGLDMHPEKTRLIEFGRFAAQNRERHGLRKPDTFEFLGLTHMCAKDRHGRFKLKRVTSKKKMRAKLKSVKTEMRRRMHHPIPEQGRWLARVLQGHYLSAEIVEAAEGAAVRLRAACGKGAAPPLVSRAGRARHGPVVAPAAPPPEATGSNAPTTLMLVVRIGARRRRGGASERSSRVALGVVPGVPGGSGNPMPAQPLGDRAAGDRKTFTWKLAQTADATHQ
jgi:group II intron reverse transcriptase/maturase